MWNNLSDASKKVYQDQYKQEMEKFSVIFSKYNNSLTPEQKQEIKDAMVEAKEAKEKRETRLSAAKRNKELGKPTKPATSYLLYSLSEQPNRSTSLTEHQSQVAKKWAALPDEV